VFQKRPRRYVLGGTASVLVGLAFGFLLAGQTAALQNKTPRPAAPAQGSSRATQATPPAAAKASAPRERIDTLAQQQFLATEEWKKTAADFDAWLDSQLFYDEARTAETRARFAVGVDRMSAEQLQRFMLDLQTKLDLLYSPIAQDAESYLAEKSAVASAAYMKRILDQIPDVLTATAAQINQQLVAYAARRQGKRDAQQRFDDNRQTRVAANQARAQDRRDAHQRAVERRGRSPAVVNASTENNFTPARDYAPHNQPQSGLGIPMMGMPLGGAGIIW
jgi:hypothetical protein